MPRSFLMGGGETGDLVRSYDWASTPLGPIETWPQSLITTVGTVLLSPVPIVLLWGEDGIMIYNDAYSAFAGGRHPQLLGSKVREGWPEVADFNDNVMRVGLAGGTLSYKDQELTLFRHGRPEQVWMNLDYSPVLDESGKPAGIIAVVVETTERVRAEAALRESERRLRAFVAASSTSMYRMSADWTELRQLDGHGFLTDTKAPSPHWLEAYLHPDDRPQVTAAIEEAIASKSMFALEHRVRLADGSLGWILSRAVPILDERGEILEWFGAASDVTDRKRAEAALQEENRTNETLNRIGAALAGELDVERLVQMVTDAGVDLTGAQFGAFFYNVLNEAGESYLLYTLSGVDRSAFSRFPMPRNTAVFAPTFEGEGVVRSDDILADPRYGRSEPYRGMPKGHLPVRSYLAVPVISRSGEVIGGLFFGHPKPGRFSERHERLMVGLASQAAIAIDNARLFQAVQQAKETLEQHVAERTAELMQAEEALRQSQKMEAVGQLTGGLAHDFNNLLTGISGSLELLQARVRQGRLNDIDRYITAAQGASKRAAALTHRLLAFARRQTLDPKPTDINHLVAGMEELIRRTIEPHITLEVVAAGGLWSALVDASQLENALLNLCINARDAMPDGGRITIETANKWLDDRAARERDLKPGQYISLCVTDTGTGMTPAVIAKAFDPFFTTKPQGQGTGLGLSMIYGFMRQSGGQVRIYSEVGQGTTMCLYLPRHYGQVEDAVVPSDLADAPRAEQGETVLIVDDEPTVRMLVTEVLEELGYAAIEAADGASGLKVLQSDVRVDLLITDVGLPGGMNGRQMADAARVSRPDLKVLFITGYAENALIGNGQLEPGMQVLTKPFVMEALANRIREMIESSKDVAGARHLPNLRRT